MGCGGLAATRSYLQVEHAGLGGIGDLLASADLVQGCGAIDRQLQKLEVCKRGDENVP